MSGDLLWSGVALLLLSSAVGGPTGPTWRTLAGQIGAVWLFFQGLLWLCGRG